MCVCLLCASSLSPYLSLFVSSHHTSLPLPVSPSVECSFQVNRKLTSKRDIAEKRGGGKGREMGG